MQTPVILFCTTSTLGLCLKSDSSVCTTTPLPPSITGPSFISLVEHTSLSHWYTSTAVLRATLAHSAVSDTGFWRAQTWSSIIQVWRVSWDFAKKLPSHTDRCVLQDEHFRPTPSLTSLRVYSSMGFWHLKKRAYHYINDFCQPSIPFMWLNPRCVDPTYPLCNHHLNWSSRQYITADRDLCTHMYTTTGSMYITTGSMHTSHMHMYTTYLVHWTELARRFRVLKNRITSSVGPNMSSPRSRKAILLCIVIWHVRWPGLRAQHYPMKYRTVTKLIDC